MNLLDNAQLSRLQQQLEQLWQQACALDQQPQKGKPQHWFDSALFNCHSPYLADYVAQCQHNVSRLQQHGPRLSAATTQRLTERIQQQIDALLRAFVTKDLHQLPSKVARNKALVQHITASSQQLYQQLSEYQQFEVRLQDMLSQAEQDNSPAGITRSLALHARLGRCRRAINEVEQQIQQRETGKLT